MEPTTQGCGLGDQKKEVLLLLRARYFCSKHPDRMCGPLDIMSTGYAVCFTSFKAIRIYKCSRQTTRVDFKVFAVTRSLMSFWLIKGIQLFDVTVVEGSLEFSEFRLGQVRLGQVRRCENSKHQCCFNDGFSLQDLLDLMSRILTSRGTGFLQNFGIYLQE